jgi:magnesium transporter
VSSFLISINAQVFRKAYKKTLGQILPSFSKRKKLNTYNPKRVIVTASDTPTSYSSFNYNSERLSHVSTASLQECTLGVQEDEVTWINIDGLHKNEVEKICHHFGIHPLLVEDILSVGQRAKADDMERHMFALMPMLSYNNDTGVVQAEQLSMVLGHNLLLSFQPDPQQDPFNTIRDRLKNESAPIRQKAAADYLAYSLMDAVVDDYFSVLEKLSDRLEKLEDEVVTRPNNSILLKITLLRHEIMVVKRAITPVRELVTSFWRSDNPLINVANRKYFKDVYDHIVLAIEYTENYREMAINVQDLYMNQVNTRMNEVMKILTVVTTLLAPATVVGGIFGMNFDKIPYAHHEHGFAIAVGVMVSLSALMLLFFRKKGWF